ncbi:rRNA processing-related protein [Trichosporon asahii var. asahii CBS 8904]|uniref:rRNA processing-related protein n=1 Tax=Trichosporon asahii var. asahii (strain CBS 8904) TaxID=1220162 RepID=K1VQU2_TRIAC|nr:rRNA processing-related protein [Trichosporon asahii var. asahii CBS 8904]
MSDPRFARLQTDPRFRRPKQKQLKTEIDDRFKDVLSEDFGKIKGKGEQGKISTGIQKLMSARVDKRGRALASTSGADEMKRFYRLKSPEGDEEEKKPIDYARGEGYLSSSGSEDEDSEDEESEIEEDVIEIGGKQRLRPHQLQADSESDSDDDQLKVDLSEDEGGINLDEDEEEDEEEEDEGPGVDPTTRLAAVNLDWDNMRADDLFILFNSFLTPVVRKGEAAPPPPGKLLSVKIYPSEFGKQRMAKEDAAGPGGGIFKVAEKKKSKRPQRKPKPESSDEEDSDDEEDEEMSEDEEGSDDEELEDDGLDAEIDNLEIVSDVESVNGEEDIDMDKLRQYQLERLRYYYAIATFSTVEAAQAVHDELNGSEFERTANILDLSYVPEDMTFAEDEVHDEATKESKSYKGNDFVTDALRHSKVKLTWDQDDPNRAKMTRRALTREEIEDADFGNLVAASSDEEVEEEEPEDEMPAEKKSKKAKAKERKEKLRSLLLQADDENGDIWGKQGTAWQEELADIKGDKAAKEEAVEITFKPGLSKDAEDENLTSLERYKLRMKEKKREKKEKMELKRAEKDDGKKSKPKDDFFGDSDSESEVEVETKPKKGKEAKGKSKTKAEKPVEDDDNGMDGIVEDDVHHHFSMKDVLAAEKEKKAGKKRSRKRKGKAGPDHVPELGPDGFKVDVSDPRFSAMYSEPAFALDPTHSKFTDIPANREILKKTREAHSAARGGAANGTDGGESKGLGDLVQSVKRKAEGSGRHRKRSRK